MGNIRVRSGPTIPGGTQQIDYTAFNLPSRVTNGSGPNASETNIVYDADGARVVKQAAALATYYAGDLYQATAVPDDASVPTSHRFLVYAAGRAVAQVDQNELAGTFDPASVRYFHDDALGSIHTTTGAAAATHRFGPFGDASSAEAPTTSAPYGYTGQEHDPELGFINMHGRVYDPTIGQFLSPDPIVQSPAGQGLNRFAYVFNSPMNYVDPSGFEADGLGIGVGVTVGAGHIAAPIIIASQYWGGGAATTETAAVATSWGAGGGGVGLGGITAGGFINSAVTVASASVAAYNVISQSSANYGSAPLPKQTITPATHSASARGSGVPSPGRVAPNSWAPVQEGGAFRASGTGGGSSPNPGPNLVRSNTGMEPLYKLDGAADVGLSHIFRFLKFNVGDIVVRFGETNGNAAFTVRNLVTLDAGSWARLDPRGQRELLAHEITHSVQYRELGVRKFLSRYKAEFPRYGVPSAFQGVPYQDVLRGLNPIDPKYSLDEIADTVADAYKRSPML